MYGNPRSSANQIWSEIRKKRRPQRRRRRKLRSCPGRKKSTPPFSGDREMDVIGIAVADAASFFLPPPSFSIIFRLIQTPELGRLWQWMREEERKGGAPPRTVGPTTLKKTGWWNAYGYRRRRPLLLYAFLAYDGQKKRKTMPAGRPTLKKLNSLAAKPN